MDYFRLIEIKTALTSDSIIFKWSLPLVDLEIFEVEAMKPIARRANNILVAKNINKEILAINDHRDYDIALVKL